MGCPAAVNKKEMPSTSSYRPISGAPRHLAFERCALGPRAHRAMSGLARGLLEGLLQHDACGEGCSMARWPGLHSLGVTVCVPAGPVLPAAVESRRPQSGLTKRPTPASEDGKLADQLPAWRPSHPTICVPLFGQMDARVHRKWNRCCRLESPRAQPHVGYARCSGLRAAATRPNGSWKHLNPTTQSHPTCVRARPRNT